MVAAANYAVGKFSENRAIPTARALCLAHRIVLPPQMDYHTRTPPSRTWACTSPDSTANRWMKPPYASQEVRWSCPTSSWLRSPAICCAIPPFPHRNLRKRLRRLQLLQWPNCYNRGSETEMPGRSQADELLHFSPTVCSNSAGSTKAPMRGAASRRIRPLLDRLIGYCLAIVVTRPLLVSA